MSATETPNPTREVFNQPPPLKGYNLYLENRPLAEAARREGADWAEENLIALGAEAGGEPLGGGGGGGGAARGGPARDREPAAAEDARPLRQPHRRGRVPPGVALADGDVGEARHARPPLARPTPGSPRGTRGADAERQRRRVRPWLPDLDDVRRGPGAPQAARAGRGV